MVASSKTIAVLVNYINYEDTIAAVESLNDQKLPLKYIFVVDNCSPNNSYYILQDFFKDSKHVIILKSDFNGGFGYGNNFAMKHALNYYDFEYFLLVNNDVILNPYVNEKFTDYFEVHDKGDIGILTGKIYYFDDANRYWYAGGELCFYTCLGKHFLEGKIDIGQADFPKEITFASGCFMFFNKRLVNQVGFIPEEYFMYLEDLDYCYSILKANLKIIYLHESIIYHKIGRSSKTTRKNPNYYFSNRNRMIFSRKHHLKHVFLIFLMYFLCTRFFKLFWFLMKGRFINTFSGVGEGLKYILVRSKQS